MCGIIGFSGKTPANPDKLALLMYLNSQSRGMDNTGIYTKETGIIKTATKAEEFLQKNQIPQCNLFIGHVRRASIGSKVEKNAHPFQYDNIVGVHNGTLENHWPMLREANKDYKPVDFDVDSQILYRLLADDNNVEGEEKDFTTLTKFLGAAALLFTDTSIENRLYAYKNSERPLYHGMIEGNMYISSLDEGLKMIGCKDIKPFSWNALNIIEDGEIKSSEVYAPAKKPVTIYTGRERSNAYNTPAYKQPNSGINYYTGRTDDEYDSDKYATYPTSTYKDTVVQRLGSIKNISDINNADLVGRWISPFADYINKPYGKEIISVTKGVWYYISDSEVSNNIEVTIIDDNQKLVPVNKYLFSSVSLSFAGYAIAMSDILDSKGKTLWKEDEIIEIIDSNIKAKSIELHHATEGRTYNINVMHLRQASVTEMKQIEDMKAVDAEIADYKEDEHHGIVDMYDKVRDIDALSKKYDKPEVPEVDTYSEVVEKLGKPVLDAESPFKDQDETLFGNDEPDTETPKDVEIIPDDEELDDEDKVVNLSTYMTVIDAIDDEVSEIGELIATTSFDELKEGYQRLKDLIAQTRDVEFVEENM